MGPLRASERGCRTCRVASPEYSASSLNFVGFIQPVISCLLERFDAIGFGARRIEDSVVAFVLVEGELNQLDSAPASGKTFVISRDKNFQNGCWYWIESPSSGFAALPELVAIRWRFLGQFRLSTLHLFRCALSCL